jgi:5-methylcytosine-specific restriction endonuclease McrA
MPYKDMQDRRFKDCKKNWREKNKETLKEKHADYYRKNKEKIIERNRKRSCTIVGRYCSLRKCLQEEGVSEFDLIWSFDFYSVLMDGAVCHYCGGSLNCTGHALDRKDNSRKHTHDNVVPCCWSCNQVKGSRFTYEQMMLLAPSLRKIREESVTPRI